jgi:1,4-alpha-glucan branching enzyme
MAGRLAIVLHSHMPYVEGFGTWPFGEEWLWEAIATSYLPLLDVLDECPGAITLSVTPVLGDQLEAPGWAPRFHAFLRDVRRESHRLDAEAATDPALRAELERSAADYERAGERLAARGDDLLGALHAHATWTSAATHAVLPLLATDAGVRLQLRTGIDAHRRRAGGRWDGGLWLPECAHEPWLDALLEEAGVHATCVDLTDVLGPDEHLRPLRSAAGPLLVPVDRRTIELVWSPRGYPAHAAYRDHHALTACHHRPWANDGSPYDRDRAAATAREHAADFVASTAERVRGGGLAVCALDTELLGHWWFEGPIWLRAVVGECAAQDLELVGLDEALRRAVASSEVDPAPADLPATTWGTPRDLSTWSAPAVAAIATAQRDAELRVLAAGPAAGERAVRELLALQSSDWAFLVSRELAAPYAHERVARHRDALHEALAGHGGSAGAVGALAPDLATAALAEP